MLYDNYFCLVESKKQQVKEVCRKTQKQGEGLEPKLSMFIFDENELVAYLSSYHEKAIKALYELAYELPVICPPRQDGGIPLSALPNGTTSKLAGLFSTLVPLMLSVKQGSCEYQF